MSREVLARYYRRESQIAMMDAIAFHRAGRHEEAEMFYHVAKSYAAMLRETERYGKPRIYDVPTCAVH